MRCHRGELLELLVPQLELMLGPLSLDRLALQLRARGFGLEPTAEAVEKILDGVFIDAGIALEVQVGTQSRMAAIHVAEYVKRKGLSPAACDIRFGLDPIGACAVCGSSLYAWPEIVAAVTGAIKGLAGIGFKGPFAVADGRVIHDAGGSEVQELAFVLAAGVAYMRALESAGVALEDCRMRSRGGSRAIHSWCCWRNPISPG